MENSLLNLHRTFMYHASWAIKKKTHPKFTSASSTRSKFTRPALQAQPPPRPHSRPGLMPSNFISASLRGNGLLSQSLCLLSKQDYSLEWTPSSVALDFQTHSMLVLTFTPTFTQRPYLALLTELFISAISPQLTKFPEAENSFAVCPLDTQVCFDDFTRQTDNT